MGFSLQHELSATNVLTMLDLGGIPLAAEARSTADPLVLAGGPVLGQSRADGPLHRRLRAGRRRRVPAGHLRPMAGNATSRARSQGRAVPFGAALPYSMCRSSTSPSLMPTDGRRDCGRRARICRHAWNRPWLQNLDTAVVPVAPIVPFIECVHERIAIEIMRGCPWRCRFCQSRALKQPLRFRRVETIVAAALQAYQATGHREIALLGLSSSDYPQIEELLKQLHAVFRPLGVSVSLPSLRVNVRGAGSATSWIPIAATA